MSRATARVAAMQMIYETCAGGEGGEDTLSMVYDELREEQRPLKDGEPTLSEREWIAKIVAGVVGELDDLDARIGAASQNWSVDRMARVDLAIMRMAVWEILHEDDVPGPVVINEAVELANRYSGEGSGRFINGILGTILRKKEAGQ
ncbi:MAG: transcription antitermination factor NusB [Clostridia bacterium]|nr:transcription antitermination factor NusB [Clostridia bacterium]